MSYYRDRCGTVVEIGDFFRHHNGWYGVVLSAKGYPLVAHPLDVSWSAGHTEFAPRKIRIMTDIPDRFVTRVMAYRLTGDTECLGR